MDQVNMIVVAVEYEDPGCDCGGRACGAKQDIGTTYNFIAVDKICHVETEVSAVNGLEEVSIMMTGNVEVVLYGQKAIASFFSQLTNAMATTSEGRENLEGLTNSISDARTAAGAKQKKGKVN